MKQLRRAAPGLFEAERIQRFMAALKSVAGVVLSRLKRKERYRGPSFILKPYSTAATGWKRHIRLFLGLALIPFCLVYGFYFALTAPYLIMQFTAPLLIPALFIIWALPDSSRAPTVLLQKLLFAFYLTLMVWPNYMALSLPGLPWITVARLTGLPLAFIMLVCTSTSKPFRRDMADILNSVPLIWKFLVGFILIQAASIVLTKDVSGSINKFFIAQYAWTGIFFASCYSFSKRGAVLRWATMLWVVAVFVGFMGVWEARMGHVPWLGHIPNFLRIEDPAVQAILAGGARRATGEYRVQSAFTTSLGLSEFISLAMPFIIYFMVEPFRLAIRVAAGLTIPFLFYVIHLTDARLGVVGFFMSVLLYVLIWGLLKWRSNKTSLLPPAIIVSYPALFCGFMAATLVVKRLHDMVWGGGDTAASTQSRNEQYRAGIEKILSHPWGYGIGTAGRTLGFSNQAGTLSIDTYWIAIALEYGVIGFILYYGMIAISIGYSARFATLEQSSDPETAFFVPVAISLTNFTIIKAIFAQEANHPLVFMMMGMVVALVYRARLSPLKAQSALVPYAAPRPAGRRLIRPFT